jgi:hypothetical protein
MPSARLVIRLGPHAGPRAILASLLILMLQGHQRAEAGTPLTECNGEEDHVPLLIDYQPTVQLPKLVNSLWSPSYIAGSCGGAPRSIIKGVRPGPEASGLRRLSRT